MRQICRASCRNFRSRIVPFKGDRGLIIMKPPDISRLRCDETEGHLRKFLRALQSLYGVE